MRRIATGFTGLAFGTFCLIVLGACVRAKGAGLSCPDWPLCFGRLIPLFDVHVAFEWSHRLLAGVITLLFALLTLWIVRIPLAWARVRTAIAFAWGILLAQVILGGLTVWLQLAPWTVTAHLLAGNIFCLLLLWVGRDLFELDPARVPVRGPWSRFATAMTWLVVPLLTLQLSLGGLVSSHMAGLACARFPTCNGVSLVPTLKGLVGLHVMHRLGGVLLLGAYTVLVLSSPRQERYGGLARTGLRLVLLQLALGVANVMFRVPVEITALHSAFAAAIVLVTSLIVREKICSRAGRVIHPSGTKRSSARVGSEVREAVEVQ